MIRHAKLSEIADILTIAKACTARMIQNGILQWNDTYPNKIIFAKDIERKELYILEMQRQIIGTIVISTQIDVEYLPVKWLTPNRNNLYIHRLAVAPHHQGKGYARHLMDFAEKKAWEDGATSVRLDTFSQNIRNQRFYETRGYQRLGAIYFKDQSDTPFYCYELLP